MAFADQPSLVAIPGMLLDEALWNDFAEYLPTDLSLIRANLAGGLTIREIADHIVASAPPKFVLLGFSLGGYVARQIADKYPARVPGLIIVASSGRPDTEQQIRNKRKAVRAVSPETYRGPSRRTIARTLLPARSSDEELIDRIRLMGNRLGYQAFAIQSSLDRTDVPLHTIACPTLIIGSASDRVRSLEESRELAYSIPNASLEVFHDSGHMIPLEQPQELARSILKWLADLEWTSALGRGTKPLSR